jgi:hypothetical protein
MSTMRRSNTPSKRQGPKQSASVLALITNYPSSNSLDTSTRNEKGSDVEDKLVSRSIGGKKMIKLDPVISFLPLASWKEFPNTHIPTQYFHVSTAFCPTSLCIHCTSGADYFSLQCTGVSGLQVLFRDDLSESKLSHSTTTEKGRRFSRNARTHVDEISIPSQSKATGGDPCEERLQEVSFGSPWPCCHVEVSFTGLAGLFISVLSVAVYGESLPSGLSTPIDIMKR